MHTHKRSWRTPLRKLGFGIPFHGYSLFFPSSLFPSIKIGENGRPSGGFFFRDRPRAVDNREREMGVRRLDMKIVFFSFSAKVCYYSVFAHIYESKGFFWCPFCSTRHLCVLNPRLLCSASKRGGIWTNWKGIKTQVSTFPISFPSKDLDHKFPSPLTDASLRQKNPQLLFSPRDHTNKSEKIARQTHLFFAHTNVEYSRKRSMWCNEPTSPRK